MAPEEEEAGPDPAIIGRQGRPWHDIPLPRAKVGYGSGAASRLFIVVGTLALASVVLALVFDHGSLINRFLDALKSFTSGFQGPPPPEHPQSGWFTLSQNLAALAAVWGVVIIVYALYRETADQWRASWRSGHVVVCGLGEKGLRAARAFRAAGERVTCIEEDAASDEANEIRSLGALVLAGDPTDIALLSTARVDRAKAIVCAGEDDNANVAIAARVSRLVPAGRRSGPADVYAHIANPELARLLDVRALGIESIRLQFFNVYDLWGQALVDRLDLDANVDDDPPPHILVAGTTLLGRSALVWFARRWYTLGAPPKRRLRITFLGDHAAAHAALLDRRFPALESTVELVAVDHTVGGSNPVDLHSLPPEATEGLTAVCPCLAEDSDNLTLALQARHRLPAGVRVIVPEGAWTGDFESLLFDPLDLGPKERIESVGYSTESDTLDLLESSRIEILAREIHAEYLKGQPSAEAGRPWNELPENLRDANRDQAHGMVRHLRAIWYELEPLYDWSVPPVTFTVLELEELAELEHMRWAAERRRQGFVYGATRGPGTHPDLVEWSELSEPVRDKDRDAARRWPGLLAQIGYGLERSPLREDLARLIHAAHLSRRLAAGDTAATRAALVPWSQLTPEQRGYSLAAADDVALKLARIGAELQPAVDGAPAFSFTSAELEHLAELEHERWCRERIELGWKLGPYDEQARTHPDLVPWADLPEERRQIDRDHILALPDLLAGISRRIVRVNSPSAG